MTWTCENCGKILLSKEEYERHTCSGNLYCTCPDCNGTGRKIQIIGQSIKCPSCGGKGKIKY